MQINGAPQTKIHARLHKELGWLELTCGPYQVHAYWTRLMPRRPGWHRFEVSRWGLVAGRLTLLAVKRAQVDPSLADGQPSSPPHLSCIEGGKR